LTALAGVAAGLVLLAISLGFAALNQGERVRLDLGFISFSSVPLPTVVFGAVLLGMGVMILVGIRSDLRVREILRGRLQQEDREERTRVDKAQRDLFRPDTDDER
jgi:uncharacterized integral membrane protein